ncbi:MAG: type II toxin-antitoxin system VapB family antitoxin [Bacteroidetes bacterium]|nr:type II toxin-antitoxin system VapB family antitoxin [Bacteroidota bacterium]MDA1121850.1 type II toxin-antitoxin system VapB family antitoxin [Bacteroidota bacterium]
MRTTLDLPQQLIEEAMELTGSKTKSRLIVDALEELIKRSKRKRILNFKGKIDLDIDLNTLRDR